MVFLFYHKMEQMINILNLKILMKIHIRIVKTMIKIIKY